MSASAGIGGYWSALAGLGATFAFGTAGLSLTSAWMRHRIESDYPPLGRFLVIDGVRIHVLDIPAHRADAPTLVILHGTASSLRDPWSALTPGLEGRFRLVFVDRPGHGYSAHREADLAGPAAQAAIVAGVLDSLEIAAAIVVGHSFGGTVAGAFAVHHPNRTAGLVMISPATHPWPGGIAWSYELVATPLLGPLVAHAMVTPLGFTLIDGSLAGVFAPEAVPSGFSERAGVPLSIRPDAFRATSLEISALKGHIAALVPLYPGINAPTVVISGEGDQVVAPQIHAAQFVRAVAGAELVSLPGVGHMPHHTHTATVVAAIERVVAQAEKAARPAPRRKAAARSPS